MRATFPAFCLSLLFQVAFCKDIEPQTVTVAGRRAASFEYWWDSELTLLKLILITGGISDPGGPYKAEIRRILPDGTESKTTYRLSRLFDDPSAIDPKLQRGDRITFSRTIRPY